MAWAGGGPWTIPDWPGGAVTTVGLLVAPRDVFAWSSNTFSATSERQLLTLTNQARASAGLRSLRVDSTLASLARWRSKDISVADSRQ